MILTLYYKGGQVKEVEIRELHIISNSHTVGKVFYRVAHE
jgi:hypothetical protein